MSKEHIYNELYDLSLILNNFSEICVDSGELIAAAESCRLNSGEDFYYYDLSKITFNLPYKPGHTIPHDAEDIIRIVLSVSVKGFFLAGNQVEDPIEELSFNLHVYGTRNPNEELFSSWHLDYHNYTEPTSSTHPKYHFTYGGRSMYDDTVRKYGQTLILPTPRISHPPMDGVLGIDFILKNYYDYEWVEGILSESKYKQIIRSAQSRLWKPYALSFASHWIKMEEYTYNPNLCAQIIFPELQ